MALLLPLYRMTSSTIRPLVPAVLDWRRRHGREDRHRIKERMGVAGLPRPEGRLVWVHAASTGDGQSLLPLIGRLAARGFHVLMSTRTLASANALNRMLPAGAFHQYMPIDVPAYVGRFLDHWQPDMVLLAGAELWPNVLIETDRRDLPVIFVNARMSDRVYGHCRRMRGLSAALMRHIDLCLARSEVDAERFVDLGAISVQTVGDLSLDQPLPGVDAAALAGFTAWIGGRPAWVSALSDPEEGALVIEAHRRLLPRHPDLVTIVMPRLPRDGVAILEAAIRQNLDAGMRSGHNRLARLPGLFVADVAGETGLFYRAAAIAFLGSASAGARSPVDAAKLGCAIVHGPHAGEFAALYDALDRAQGALVAPDAAALARAVGGLLDDAARLRLVQRNAKQVMDRLCGGTSRIMRAIEPHVVQTLLER